MTAPTRDTRTPALREKIISGWYRRGVPPFGARIVSRVYGALAAGRRALYRRGVLTTRRLDAPVIVVGNITVGGTGKTPLTLWLAQALIGAGRRPGIVCRAYAARARAPAQVSPLDDPRINGDEAVLMAQRANCPVWSGPNRAETAAAMLAAGPELDVVLCDDGLQHYALARDVELVVVDAARGFGNGWLLPAGPLREPIARLNCVDAIVLNGEDDGPSLPAHVPRYVMRLGGSIFAHVNAPSRTLAPIDIPGRRIAAVAGIGHPDRFFRHLQSLGVEFDAYPFPDHHCYTAADLQRIQADCVLMTEKDAIKCARFTDARMWSLRVAADVDVALSEFILRRIDDWSSGAHSATAKYPLEK